MANQVNIDQGALRALLIAQGLWDSARSEVVDVKGTSLTTS